MKIDRRAVAIALVLGVGCVHFFGGNEVGFLYSHQGEKTRVSSSTHPLLLVWAVMGILFYWFLMRRELRAETGDAAGLLRRFFAFLIDLYFVTLISGGILALVPLLVEARRTGHFAWTFGRGYSVASDDYLFFPLSLIGVIIFFFYFAYPLLIGKQSVGDYLLRLRVTPINKVRLASTKRGTSAKIPPLINVTKAGVPECDLPDTGPSVSCMNRNRGSIVKLLDH